MVASTPTDPEPWEEIDRVDNHDVDLADLSPIPAPDRQRIYSHGFTMRVDLKVADSEPYMQKIGWSPEVQTWIHSRPKYGHRSLIRGSTYVTQRAPQRNARSPIAALNRRLNTKLYAIEYDRAPEGSFLILRGVRQADVARLLEEAMGLQRDQYEIAYYLDIERYMVLAPREAHVVADALGGDPSAGRGRLARKRWLAKDLEVPVRVRARAVRNARLTIYRIDRGVTAQFKVEIALKGRRQRTRS